LSQIYDYCNDIEQYDGEVECGVCSWKGKESELFLEDFPFCCPACGLRKVKVTAEQLLKNWEQSIRMQYREEIEQMWERHLKVSGLIWKRRDDPRVLEERQKFGKSFVCQDKIKEMNRIIKEAKL